MTVIEAPAMKGVAARAQDVARGYWWKLFVCILVVKGLMVCVDHTPRFFLGDSLSYMKTATSYWVPRDRSFFYGWQVHVFGVAPGSLTVLIAAQAGASACCALMCAFILRNYFGISRRVAAAAALVCAVEPLQLLYERYVMTESFSLLAFAAMTAAALEYMKRPTWKGVVVVQMAAVWVVSMRVSFLPVVEATTLLAPVLAWRGVGGGNWKKRWRSVGWHVVLSCVLFVGMQGAYKRFYAELMRVQLPAAMPAYNYENGFHLLCFVAPLVEAEDFPDRAKAEEIYAKLAFSLEENKNRDRHRWHDGGLINNVKEAYPDPLEANRVAEMAAIHAVKRKPLGELKLAWFGFTDYWNLGRLKRGLLTDQGGDRAMPEELLGLLRENFGVEGAGLMQAESVTSRYFFAAWPWYLALLLLPGPAVVMAVVCRREERRGAVLIVVFVVLQIAIIAAFSLSPTVRFLHSVAWMGVIVGGVLVGKVRGSRSFEV